MARPSIGERLGVRAFVLAFVLAGAGCAAAVGAAPGTIGVVAAENEYGDVVSQVGGSQVTVTSVESDPNTDPHSYEVSPTVAEEVAQAQLVIQNGLGYDDFMTRIEAASPSASRRVIDVQNLLGLPDSTPNPHLWYDPSTMPAVARALTADLSALQPAHAAYFSTNLARFMGALQPWLDAVRRFKTALPGIPVAVTEPVADYMLQAAGTNDLTPFSLQADIMNGVDPAPQDVALEDGLLTQHRVRALLYNEQVTDPVTQDFLALAQQNGIPVVAVYETMPVPGYNYQSWMVAELDALQRAVSAGVSTERL